MEKEFNLNNSEAWELEYSPVWHEHEGSVIPSFLSLKWWLAVAQKQYGDEDYWLEAAYDLGYVMKIINPESGNTIYEPCRFEYDSTLMRKSLGLSNSDPLIFQSLSINSQPYFHLWDMLFNEENSQST